MSDTPAFPISPGACISDETVAYQRGLLADPDFAASPMGQMVAKTLGDAVSATGWTDPAVADTRTPAEKLHDREHGVEPHTASEYEMPMRANPDFEPETIGTAREFMAAVGLDQIVGSAILRDIAEQDGDVDQDEVRQHIERCGKTYSEELAYAQFALDRGNVQFSGGKIEAKDLSAHSIVMLALHGRQLQKHGGKR